MAAFGLEIVGVSLSVLGWILSIVCCALPMWRVSAFIGNNIVTAQVYWEGIWMSCVFQSTGQMQCKVYDSMLALPADLQAARALVVVSVIVGILALLVAVVGAKCTNCIEDEATKARVMISSGAAFITAAVLQLIPVSWSANTVVREFYSPVVPEAQKMEIGASLYLGWAAAALLMVGGSILCCSCPPSDKPRYPPQSRISYSAHHSVAPSTYNKRDYVWGAQKTFVESLNFWKSSLRVNSEYSVTASLCECFYMFFSKVCFCFVHTVPVITPHLNLLNLFCILYVINQIDYDLGRVIEHVRAKVR